MIINAVTSVFNHVGTDTMVKSKPTENENRFLWGEERGAGARVSRIECVDNYP